METKAIPFHHTPNQTRIGLLDFFVRRLLTAGAAELLQLELEFLLLPALIVIILVLADGAAENDDVSVSHGVKR